MPSKANDTAAIETAPALPETAHQPYCLCGTHGSYKMIAGLAIGFFLLITAFASGVFAGKITSRFGSGYEHRGMMSGYGRSYHGSTGACDNVGSGYGRGMRRDYGGYGQGMMRGYR